MSMLDRGALVLLLVVVVFIAAAGCTVLLGKGAW